MGPGRAGLRQPRRRTRPGFLATRSLPAKVAAVHRRLEEAGIPHAFGGALALAYYAESRETNDIDVNIFLPAEENELKLDWGGTPVHFFFSCDPLHEEMEKQVREIPLGDGTIPLISPEHLVIRKTLLGRPKDKRDIEGIAAAVDLDWEEIESWVQRLAAS